MVKSFVRLALIDFECWKRDQFKQFCERFRDDNDEIIQAAFRVLEPAERYGHLDRLGDTQLIVMDWIRLKNQPDYQAAIERSGFDLSECMVCGQTVVCIPDGLTMCEACAAKEMSTQ